MSASHPIAPPLSRIFGRNGRQPSGPAADLDVLLARIRNRLYPETVPVLASWWLKTVYTAGHNRVWWGELDVALGRVLRHESLDATTAEALRDIRDWVRQAILPRHKAPEASPLIAPPYRPDLTAEQAASYLSRVLNEWLPAEVARLLAESDEEGMSPLTVGRALERLLLREHFSPQSLELLLDTSWSSPHAVYPAHAEILRDIVLALLGRIADPPPAVLPATALEGPQNALDRATVLADEIHVPLDQSQALELLRHDPVHIGSIIVSMDGRWWHSARLQTGPENETAIVYRPGGRLRIDFTAEHARLTVPWPDPHPHWPGEVHLPDCVALFGREWRGRTWERSADRTWLHLEFSRALTISEGADADETRPRRLRPASVEMAWSEVEQALAAGDPAVIDQLRREELIPLAHALERLSASLLRSWVPSRSEIAQAVNSVRYLHGAIDAAYGRIPWRVLPAPARNALRKRRDALEFLAPVFEPAAVGNSPRQAA
jgi:hypothetical protein